MRRAGIAAAALAICLLLSSCALVNGIRSLTSGQSTKTKTTSLSSRGDGTVKVQNTSAGTLLDYFSQVAIGSEYGESANIVCKWTKAVKYWIEGDATGSDRELIYRLCDTLNGIEGFPGISEANSSSSANMTVSFVSRSEIMSMFPDANEKCSGMASYEWENATGKIISARCAIDVALTNERQCTICEEFLQSLGPARDSYMFPSSVFYQGFTLTPFPTAVDFAIMEILYSPALPVGTERVEAMGIAATIVDWEE